MGALSGIRIIELSAQGALPFAALKLADMGADIIRVERTVDVPADPSPMPHNFWDRGRRSIAIDLKHPDGVQTLLRLCEKVDVLLESFRPGVMERLGLGPDVVMERNPKIIYGRMTGWGQDGPLAHAAGHSLNYEALTGLSRAIGPRGGAPVPLLQIFGDFAGGGMHMAYGVVCALFEAQRSGRGQVIDCAMVDGVMSLVQPFYAMHQLGMHSDQLGTNLFDGGAPYYDIYATSDGQYVSVAPIEPKFYAQLLAKLGLDASTLPDQHDQSRWPELRDAIAAAFATKTRDEWCVLLEGTDVCFAPVLNFTEARHHPHNVARGCFIADDPMPELAPAPRLSRTPGDPGPSPRWLGADTDDVLNELGFEKGEIDTLRHTRAIA